MISSLIIIIISITLMSIFLYSGINYINIDSYENRMLESKIPTDLYSYTLAIETYRENYNFYPREISWKEDLKSINALLPAVKNTEYTYKNENGNVGICIQKTIKDKKQFESVLKIQEKGFTILSKNCFSRSNENIDTSKFPQKVAITKWIK